MDSCCNLKMYSSVSEAGTLYKKGSWWWIVLLVIIIVLLLLVFVFLLTRYARNVQKKGKYDVKDIKNGKKNQKNGVVDL